MTNITVSQGTIYIEPENTINQNTSCVVLIIIDFMCCSLSFPTALTSVIKEKKKIIFFGKKSISLLVFNVCGISTDTIRDSL